MVKKKTELQNFLYLYNSLYSNLLTLFQHASFQAALNKNESNDSIALIAERVLLTFQGNQEINSQARELLASISQSKGKKIELQRLQLIKILSSGAEFPQTKNGIGNLRLLKEAKQSALASSLVYYIDSESKTLSDIDNILLSSDNEILKIKACKAYFSNGEILKPRLNDLVFIRNKVAKEMGFPSYFNLQTSDVQKTTIELINDLDNALDNTTPLFYKLKDWASVKLSKKFGIEDPPALIPIHWCADRFGQSWSGLSSINFDEELIKRNNVWMIKSAKDFFSSIGLKLPKSFWEKSIFIPFEKRNIIGGASCLHLDLKQDIRAIMNIECTSYWYGAVYHELGHAYYYSTYGSENIPPILKTGASRAMHEGIAEFFRLLTYQPTHLKMLGIIKDPKKILMELRTKECLEIGLPFFQWSAGTVTHFEYEIYEKNLALKEWQNAWQNGMLKYQGIDTSNIKISDRCDPALADNINLNPCYYYNYALATMIKFQLYEKLYKDILNEDPETFCLKGQKKVGEFLHEMMKCAATKSWDEFCTTFLDGQITSKYMTERYALLINNLE